MSEYKKCTVKIKKGEMEIKDESGKKMDGFSSFKIFQSPEMKSPRMIVQRQDSDTKETYDVKDMEYDGDGEYAEEKKTKEKEKDKS